MTKTRPQIALLVEASRAYGRELLRGVARFARTQVQWSLIHEERMLDSAMPDWISSARIDGVIARVDRVSVKPLQALRVPIVDVRCNNKFVGIPQVETDNQEVARMAFEHLWDRGFRRFAFAGFRFAAYSDARLKSFHGLVEHANCPFSSYQTRAEPGSTITTLERSGLKDTSELSQWLMSLTRPTGLFVCNDIRGQQVLNVCRTLELSVPDDFGVIGVDDDDAICLMCEPSLSSVHPNAEQVGYRASALLHEMMSGLRPELEIEYVAPQSVTERMSTKVLAVEDEELAKICRFIRMRACGGMKVSDILGVTSFSRRQLERRCREELGLTPHQLIANTQVDRVKQLLRETEMTLQQIADRSGYSHKESLSAVFKRETGQTPGAYRIAVRTT